MHTGSREGGAAPPSRRSARAIVRSAALSAFATFYRVTGRYDALARNRVQFLYLHHVYEHEEDAFRRLVGELAREHRLIGYGEAVQRVESGAIDAPYVAFSFDDGLRCCMRAAKILEEFGATACFFVCPGVIDGEEGERRAFFQRIHSPPVGLMSWDDLADLADRGHEIGGHTMTHRNLAALPATEATDEIAGCHDALDLRLGGAEHFSWPYGRFAHMTSQAATAVYDAGFVSCASAERGCHLPVDAAPVRHPCIRRDHVKASWPLDHVRLFLARSSRHGGSVATGWPASWRESVAAGEA